MNIKSVRCPKCGFVNSVAASMASIKCQECGIVFLADDNSAMNSTASASGFQDSGPLDSEPMSEERIGQWLIVGAVAVMALVGLGLLAVVQFSGTNEPERNPGDVPMRSQATVVEEVIEDQPTEGTQEYRVVKLAESTRKKIYRDYSKMIQSSFGKSEKIPQSGAAGQMLNSTLGGIVDREVRNMATIHGITEEDIAQIYLEGQAKGW